MFLITKTIAPNNFLSTLRGSSACINRLSTQTSEQKIEDDEEFRVLNLRQVKSQVRQKRKINRPNVLPPREKQMEIDQDWGSVWTGPRSFHPASVPLPIRQGFTPKGVPAPGKFANAELMKIPNFLHLTPPVIKKQCEALKKFCTKWPTVGLENDEQIAKHFPIEIITSDYCHGLPTIRNPLSRIVTIKLKLSNLPLDKHARDKFLRLVGERYNAETDMLTIVTDRCPLRKQNYEYAQYLLTAVFHESWITEPWESSKTEADMEEYIWSRNKSKISAETILNYVDSSSSSEDGGQSGASNRIVPDEYIKSVEQLINDGENEYNLDKYKEGVLKLLNMPIVNTKLNE